MVSMPCLQAHSKKSMRVADVTLGPSLSCSGRPVLRRLLIETDDALTARGQLRTHLTPERTGSTGDQHSFRAHVRTDPLSG